MDAHYERLLHDLQANSFVLIDLQLYLDTHPDDAAALQDFATYTQRNRLLHRAFEERYGPLNDNGESSSARADLWIDAPWPWEV